MDTQDYVQQYVSGDWTPFSVTRFPAAPGVEIIIVVAENTADGPSDPRPTIMLTEIQIGRLFPDDPEVKETSLILDHGIAARVAQAILTRQRITAARKPVDGA